MVSIAPSHMRNVVLCSCACMHVSMCSYKNSSACVFVCVCVGGGMYECLFIFFLEFILHFFLHDFALIFTIFSRKSS